MRVCESSRSQSTEWSSRLLVWSNRPRVSSPKVITAMPMVRVLRSAFTLTELLVVIAIVAVLLSMIVPAVMNVRAAASKTKCANNLRQIGLAVHLYHHDKRSFPAGMRYQNGRDPYYLMSWQAQLLPYIEEGSVWEMAEQDYRASRDPLHPPHRGLATRVPIYICPADPRADQLQIARREGYVVALTSYLGVSGQDLTTRHDTSIGSPWSRRCRVRRPCPRE